VRAALPTTSSLESAPSLVPLCRDDAQLDAVLDAGAREVELDWMELVGLARAVARAVFEAVALPGGLPSWQDCHS